VIVVLSLLLASRKDWPTLVIFWIFVLVLWVSFFKPTQCDVEKSDGEGCGNPAHGRLRACHLVKHKRAKHDALWTMFRLKTRRFATGLFGLIHAQVTAACLRNPRNRHHGSCGRCMTAPCSWQLCLGRQRQ
jgi:hypothetical protein